LEMLDNNIDNITRVLDGENSLKDRG